MDILYFLKSKTIKRKKIIFEIMATNIEKPIENISKWGLKIKTTIYNLLDNIRSVHFQERLSGEVNKRMFLETLPLFKELINVMTDQNKEKENLLYHVGLKILIYLHLTSRSLDRKSLMSSIEYAIDHETDLYHQLIEGVGLLYSKIDLFLLKYHFALKGINRLNLSHIEDYQLEEDINRDSYILMINLEPRLFQEEEWDIHISLYSNHLLDVMFSLIDQLDADAKLTEIINEQLKI